MATGTSTNRLIAALLERLETGLPALLAAAGLPAVNEFLSYDPIPLPSRAPQVWIDIASAGRNTDTRQGATLQRYVNVRRVVIGVTAAGNDPAAAAARLRATADLIRTALEGDQSAGGEGWTVRWLGTNFSQNMAQNATSLFQGALLTFEVPRQTRIGED